MDLEEPMVNGSCENEEFCLIGDSFDDRIPHITVSGDEYSDKPTSDRETLTHWINRLAKKTYERLMRETSDNHRYYQRLFISNRIDGGCNKNSFQRREHIKVKLPAFATAWNELDEDDLNLQMLKAVVKIEPNHEWYQVKVHLDYPYDKETRDIIEELFLKEGFEIGLSFKSDDSPERTVPIQSDQPQIRSVSSKQSSESSNQYLELCRAPITKATNPSCITPIKSESNCKSGRPKSSNSCRQRKNKKPSTPNIKLNPTNDVPLLAGLFGNLARPAHSPKPLTNNQALLPPPESPFLITYAEQVNKQSPAPGPNIPGPANDDDSDEDIEILYENVTKKQMVTLGNVQRK